MNDLSGFFLKCLGLDSLFHISPLGLVAGYFTFKSAEWIRTVTVNRLVSHLHLSCGQLQASAAALLSQKWHSLAEEDRSLLVAFQARLSYGTLAASPFEMYAVKPSNLVSMLSLILTYIVVLLQLHF